MEPVMSLGSLYVCLHVYPGDATAKWPDDRDLSKVVDIRGVTFYFRDEATALGHADRILYVDGDFVEMQDRVQPADIVTLDRVICCYRDMPALVDASASRAVRVYGLVYPRDTRLARLAIGAVNLLHWLGRHPFRAYVHPTEAVEARIEGHGLTRAWHSSTLLWQITVFSRPHPPSANGG